MLVRNHHDVPGRIREGIQDHEAVFAPERDSGFLIVSKFQGPAEDTARGKFDAGHVRVAPRRPEIVHASGRVAEGSGNLGAKACEKAGFTGESRAAKKI